TTESQMNGYQDSWLAARIRDEATTRATQTDALSNRSASLEANYSKLSDNVNGTIFPGFERKYDGWNTDTDWQDITQELHGRMQVEVPA
ncbi:hypothetical protein, partial [Parvimonas sp. M13]|uniref:hypothetical protein n=1 Tax=Parvimonas sp. M13 TaxID=3110694 RepID=UPI002B474E00